MWTPGGQLDLLSFHGVWKKGGSSVQQAESQPRSYVDPVDGTVFVDPPGSQYLLNPGQWTADNPQPKSGAQQLNEHIAARKAQELADSQTATNTANEAKTTTHNEFLTNRQTAYDQALEAVKRSFGLQGVDPNAYLTSDIVPTLQRTMNAIPTDDPNPSKYFTDTLDDDILNNLTSGRRTQVSNQFNSIFTPDYANQLLPDSTVDQYAGTILGEQFDPLSQQLENAFKRNTLDQSGFDAANKLLASKRSSGLATIQNLGRDILTSDRDAVGGIVSGGRNALSNLSLGQQFDPTTYDTQARSRASSELGSFAGELRSKLGDTKFTNLGELINAGGGAQGPINAGVDPSKAGQASPFAVDPEEEAKKARGLGNTGAF